MKRVPHLGRNLSCFLSIALFVLPASARAGYGFAEFAKYPTRTAELVGWSKDSSTLFYHRCIEYAPGRYERSDPMEIVMLSGRSGKEARRVDKVDSALIETQNGLVLIGNLGNSQEAHAKVILQIKGGTWGPNRDGWYIEGGAGMRIPSALQKRDDTRTITPSHIFTAPKDATGLEITFLWSPDGKRIAWLFQGQRKSGVTERAPNGTPLNPSFAEIVLDRTWGPRIQIIGKGLLFDVFDKIATAIEQAGFAPTSEKEEPHQRSKSVVYTRKGFQEDAKKIAAVIPGGATVEPLKQKGVFDVVVALGQSANTK